MAATAPILPNPFTWSQAQALGISRAALDSLLDSRQVVRVLHGVYQPADLANCPANRIAAARLVVPPFAVICDRLAAWVYGVNTFSIQELDRLPDIETCVPPDKTRIRRQGCKGSRRDLLPSDVVLINGTPVTSDVRTALDLACKLGKRDALAVLDGFMRVRGLTRSDFEQQLTRYRTRRGVVQLRRLVPLADPLAESPGESWTRLVIIDEGLPIPALQHSIRVNGREVYRLDLAYVLQMIAIEYDGVEFHDSPEQRRYDKVRREWLAAHGWTVIVIRKDSFVGDALEQWTSQLHRLLRKAA